MGSMRAVFGDFRRHTEHGATDRIGGGRASPRAATPRRRRRHTEHSEHTATFFP